MYMHSRESWGKFPTIRGIRLWGLGTNFAWHWDEELSKKIEEEDLGRYLRR